MRFVCLFLVTSLLTRTVTANVFNSQHPSLTCPNAEGSNDFFNEGMVNLDISNGICTLVRIAPDGKSFKPMGRSYEGHPWEASAGEFKSLTFECNTSSCTVNLPALPTGAVYQLTTFDTPNYSDRDIKARFLEQSTFGPTRSDIGYFNGVDTMDFALWIEQQQQQQSTMSSHRQFYRSRANTRQEVAVPQGAVTYPCQKGAVYRRFALSSKDSKKQLEIETSGTMRILRVDGFVRTVVEGPVHWREDASVTFDDGSYEIEWQLRPSNKIGGILFLRHPGQNKLLEVSFGGHHGNPPIQFSLGEVPNVQVGIANNAARPIDTKYFQREDESVQEIILTKALTDYKCPYMRQTGNPTNPVFASFYGVYWIHDPRFITIDNTLEEPAPDGGGSVKRKTANIIHPEYASVCANAPRTFLNEESCVLSDDVTACSLGKRTFEWQAIENDIPEFTLQLTPENLRSIYEITGNGVEGTRYVYSIGGLRASDDVTLSPPCQKNAMSRWIRVDCTGAAATLDPDVHGMFQWLISHRQSDNPNLKQVWNWLSQECPAPLFNITDFEIEDNDGDCWLHVHPDEGNVYDFTGWTQNHPGNLPPRNPIKEFGEQGNSTLMFPWHHEIDRWQSSKWRFPFMGRLYDTVHYLKLPSHLRTPALNEFFRFTPDAIKYEDADGVMVCGSPNECSNDLQAGGSQQRGAFESLQNDFRTSEGDDYVRQKKIVWTEIALTAEDQLRQRVAWALSQIIAIPYANTLLTEDVLVSYDIFVRNAFGNYRDVLKEAAYSPLMGHSLTYYNSQSTAYTFEKSGNVEYADENFAREIMQLFTTGTVMLNEDGSEILDGNGDTVRAYTNDDILEYARVWTGFESQPWRGNIELLYTNQIDPMNIRLAFRDLFPKMGLNRRYIGDGVPLCADLPDKHFLKRGATYRLLGRNPSPTLQMEDPAEWETDPNMQHMTLQEGGDLFMALCGSQSAANCQFSAKVVLDHSIDCIGDECNVDTLRTVEVADGIFYEYVRPPCVYQAFFNDAKMLSRREGWRRVTCGDPRTESASVACCGSEGRVWNDLYWGERLTFAAAVERCGDQDICSRSTPPSCDKSSVGEYCANYAHFWTPTPCTIQAKISRDGTVGIVHAPSGFGSNSIEKRVQEDTKTFFRVDWTGDFASIIDSCGSIGSCYATVDDMCMCDVTVTDEQVYFDGDTMTEEQVLSTLRIGAFHPDMDASFVSSGSNGNVSWFAKNGSLTADSIFEITDKNSILHHRKNTKSTVGIVGSNVTFRNAVHFNSVSEPEARDAHYETNAALDHYFYHPNVAPFLAIRFAQRFGISNPSPRYIETIAAAFRTGSYNCTSSGASISYGTGKYGDLAATIASVLLDREARSVVLDTDPSFGSLKEPLIKLISLMRSLEFTRYYDNDFVDLATDMDARIGQMAQEIPTVFSFFLPEYQPSGPVTQASLVAPEAQIMTGPRSVNFLNGLTSLIKHGLSHCFSGFGVEKPYTKADCTKYFPGQFNGGSRGALSYSPMDTSSTTDELATLLTAGRLSADNRRIIGEVINEEPDPIMKIVKAQQLMVYAPEFHSTNIARKNGQTRPEPPVQPASTNDYKAIVYILLDGGADTFNMLAPHTCNQTNDKNETLLEQYYSERKSLAITSDERSLIIDAEGQPCSQFVIHEKLPFIKQLYDEGDLAFFANAGAIHKPVDKDNYGVLTTTQLFAHNAMQQEAQRLDPADAMPGTGVLGRMCDVLSNNGYNAQPITVEDACVATVGVPGEGVDPQSVSTAGAKEFDPKPDTDTFDPRSYIDQLNDATRLQSSVYGETWSNGIQKALDDNEKIRQALSTSQLKTNFVIDSGYAEKLRVATTLIASRTERGTDRDVFFVGLPGWDDHSEMKRNLANKFKDLNSALASFVQEMTLQGIWNSTTVVITSDFGRTLTPNSGVGSDHAWGGNYFVAGGSVKGGRIHGEYPADITDAGPLNVGRGRLIPTTSWESILNSCLQWMGVPDKNLDYCLPNRNNTGTKLFTAAEVFETI